MRYGGVEAAGQHLSRWPLAALGEKSRTGASRVSVGKGFVLTNKIRIVRHEAVPQTGSYEVRFFDGRPSQFFYFDDIASRRSRLEMLTSKQALEHARRVARAERDKG